MFYRCLQFVKILKNENDFEKQNKKVSNSLSSSRSSEQRKHSKLKREIENEHRNGIKIMLIST